MIYYVIISISSNTLTSFLLLSISGDAIGFFSAPLKQIAGNMLDNIDQSSHFDNLAWIDLFSAKSAVRMILWFYFYCYLLGPDDSVCL